MCTGKAANWKHIQLELGESYDIPDYLLSWGSLQDEFKLKWADLNSKEKAQDQFHVAIKQTSSVHQYTKTFEEVILKAEFTNKQILASAFYTGLKPKIKMHLVGWHPDMLKELKSVAIRLDKECMTTQGSDHCEARPRPSNHALEIVSTLRSEAATWQSMLEIKAETVQIGAGLLKEERERRLKEGRCFGCGKKGHR